MSSSLTPLGRRICVVGTSGAGKTHVAKALAATLGLKYIDNDAIYITKGLQPAPRDQVYQQLDSETADEGWTFDGNLAEGPDDLLVLGRSDTLVWLDMPRLLAHWRMLTRTVRQILTKEELWHGNTRSWRSLFSANSLLWLVIKNYPAGQRRRLALFNDPQYAGKARIRLGSRRAVDAWLAALGSGPLP